MADEKNNNTPPTIEKLNTSVARERNIPYTSLSNNVIQNLADADSLAAWCYLQTLPPHWHVVKEHIRNHFGWGKNKIDSVFSNLKKKNLIEYIRERNQDGTLSEVKIIIKWGEDFRHDSTTPIEIMCVDDPVSARVSTTAIETMRVENHAHGFQHTINNISNINKTIENTMPILPTEYKETYFPMPKVPTSPKGELQMNELLQNNPHHIPTQYIQDHMVIRKKKKAPLTSTAWSRLNKELFKCPNPIEAFEEMILRGWIGFKAEWINKTKSHFDNVNTSWIKDIREDIF